MEHAQSTTVVGAEIPTLFRLFDERQFNVLRALCAAIIPAEGSCGGALEAGAPEFIDLLASENEQYRIKLTDGLAWLDKTCQARYGAPYATCLSHQQMEILELIAYRQNANSDASLEGAVAFFALVRKLAFGAFFSSKIGIQYLGYVGNTHLEEFPGCPVPDGWPTQGSENGQ
jgi:gluconate 2-dehydrogenase gamma chain